MEHTPAASIKARELFSAAEVLTNRLKPNVDVQHFSVIPSDGHLTILVDNPDAHQAICLLAPSQYIDFDLNVFDVRVRYVER